MKRPIPFPRPPSLLLILLFLFFLPTRSHSDPLTDIKPGEWYEAPNTKLDALTPNPLPTGNNGFKAVMQSWSGAGYDSKRDRLIVWGGGHQDYSGNEMYGFDINKLAWEKLSNASIDVGGDESSGEYPDGQPRARHTYDYIQYVPALDAFCSLGGQVMFPSGQKSTNKTHCFDFVTQKWTRKNLGAEGAIGGLSGVDESTGKVWEHSTGNSARLLEWDPVADVWKPHVVYSKGWFDYYYTASVGAGKFIAVGKTGAGKFMMMVWDLSNPDKEAVVTDLPANVIIKNNPGFVFDTKRNLFVAWAGGTRIFILNPTTLSWGELTLAPTNKMIPTDAELYGTYGRFRYIASKDLFIVVNRTSENVYFFRMPTTLVIGNKKAPSRKIKQKSNPLKVYKLNGKRS